jgi:two-component system, NarL family, sensor histidine kinase UhpB
MKAILNDLESQLAVEYEAVLRDYLDEIGEAALKRAYDLGRRALADGLGVLDMARVHHEALLGMSPSTFTSEERLKRCERVFVESMTPFEMTHRGFRESYAALHASEARYRELFENANDIVFSTDLEGNFTSVNPAGERLSGYALSEAQALNFSAIVAPECVEIARRARQAKLSGKEGRYELAILAKDGSRIPLEVNTRLVYQQGVPVGFQGIARDITERKQADRALRQLNERLEEEAKRIAHALHNEAGQMLSAVYLALAEIASELPAAREQLRRISAPLDQVGEQLRRLSHELRPVILDDFGLVAALEFLADGVRRRTHLIVTVESSIEGRLPSQVEITLYRILQEALTNVTKHARATRARIKLGQTDQMLTSSIQDDGIGLDPTRLFPQPGGRGLGLIGIRERLGGVRGTFSIISGVGQGTTLEISIPLETIQCAKVGGALARIA